MSIVERDVVRMYVFLTEVIEQDVRKSGLDKLTFINYPSISSLDETSELQAKSLFQQHLLHPNIGRISKLFCRA